MTSLHNTFCSCFFMVGLYVVFYGCHNGSLTSISVLYPIRRWEPMVEGLKLTQFGCTQKRDNADIV